MAPWKSVFLYSVVFRVHVSLPVCITFSLSSVAALGVLAVGVKGRYCIEVLHRGVWLFHFVAICAMPSCLSESSKCISTAHARKIWWGAAGARHDCALVVVPCCSQGKPRVLVVQSRLFMTGARDRSGSISMCRFRGKAQRFGHGGNLDML